MLGVRYATGIVAVVGRAGEVYGRAESGTGMGLGILRVGPPEAEVTGLHEVCAALFTRLVIGIGEGYLAVELVVYLIS